MTKLINSHHTQNCDDIFSKKQQTVWHERGKNHLLKPFKKWTCVCYNWEYKNIERSTPHLKKSLVAKHKFGMILGYPESKLCQRWIL